MTQLEVLGKKHTLLRPLMKAALKFAYKYYKRMDDTDAYVVTMCKYINTASNSFNSTYSPQPHDTVRAVRKGMGGEICPESKDSYFEAREYNQYNLSLHPRSQPSVAQMKVYRAKSMHASATTPSLSVHSSPVKGRLSISRAPRSKFKIDPSDYERRPKACSSIHK
jgi:hypothetical protein